MARPPLDKNDPSVTVQVTVPSKQYDALCQRAIKAAVSVPEIIRRDLKKINNPGAPSS